MIYVALVLVAYLAWWQWLYKKGGPEPIPYLCKFNNPFAHWVWQRKSKTASNYAITLPHPFKRCACVLVGRHFIRAPHLRHEAKGHGRTLSRLGPLDYLPTYVWHFCILRRSAAEHLMEKEANRLALLPGGYYPAIGKP